MPSRRPEAQYATLDQQSEAAELGIWVFLATEVLFIGGMTLAYLLYRHAYPEAFVAAAKESILAIGAINTVILVTSSLTMVLAIHGLRLGRARLSFDLLVATAGLGTGFLCLKGYEYYLDYKDHVVPLLGFHVDTQNEGAAKLFWLFYFYATGIHAVHLTVGIALVLFMAVRVRRAELTAAYSTPLEVTGLYWSFVDVVWIFLFALIYPIGRAGG